VHIELSGGIMPSYGTTASKGMDVAEALALPVVTTLEDSNRAFGIGRTTGYSLARRGEYPVPVLRLGNAYRVRRADILRALGIDEPSPA
jgi:hypothetical protein